MVDYYLIGDAAFPLQTWLMKPYIEHPYIPQSQKRFNYRLSRSRMTIECAFGRMKGKLKSRLHKKYVFFHLNAIFLLKKDDGEFY